MPVCPTSPRPFNPQQVRPRQIPVQLGSEIPRLWFRNCSIMTHLLNGTNLFLPAFEAYMVRTAQGQLKHLSDAALRSQVSGLIAQEARHSQAHQQYNDVLRQQGYCFETYLKGIHFLFERLLPKLGISMQLATIAGFEHVTASLSEIALHYNTLEQAHPTMKRLWEWHAAEELEHKAIAFDLFQAISGTYWRRVAGGALGTAIVISCMVIGMLLLSAQDAEFFSLKTLADLNKLFVTDDQLLPRGLRRMIPYFRPGFHPCQREDPHYAKQIFQ